MKKKNILVTLVSLIVVLSIGLTYALFYTSVTQSDLNALNTSCFDVSYTENSNSINLINSYPMKDSKGLKLEPYTFTITNTCNTTSEYVVTLNTTNSSSTILLPYINMSLDKTNVKRLNSYNTVNQENNLKTLYNINKSFEISSGSLEENESRTYNLNLWIDESAGNNIMGESFEGRVIVINKAANINPADVTLAVKLQDKENNEWLSTYTNASNFPDSSSGYLYQGIECDDPNVEVTAEWDNENYQITNFSINVINKPVKCYIKFGNKLGGDYILSTWTDNNIPINTTDTPDFSQVATTEEGVFTADDDYTAETGKKSYYVRGSSSYNYIKFGKDADNNDIWWRIIRINGDGSVRMIYQGTATSGNTPALTGETTGINVSEITNFLFSISDTAYNSSEYVGYMYTLGERQGLTESSNAKTQLEAWYRTNFVDNGANATSRNYIADKIFCGDRTSSTSPTTTWTTPFTSSGGTGTTSNTYYGAYLRLANNTKSPILICPENPDKYTSKNANHGNKLLEYPIGLITADEISMAGGVRGTNNFNLEYYLYTNQNYWTMTPDNFSGGSSGIWSVRSTGQFSFHSPVYNIGLRAVINISPNITLSGNGTTTSPFQLAS